MNLDSPTNDPAERFNASAACLALYYDLTYFTLSLGDPEFVHQVAVDAYGAQHAGPEVKPISTTFALVGLYLLWERQFTGRQVQRVHMALADRSSTWPEFSVPTDKATLTILDVVSSSDSSKHRAIHEWSQAVWTLWKHEEARIAELLHTHMQI